MTVYAVAKVVPDWCKFITVGKEYVVHQELELFNVPKFTATGDNGLGFVSSWDDWTRIERDEP